MGSIPWTAIVAWCEFHELDREAAHVMIHVIRSLDVERSRAVAAKAAREKATGEGRGKGRR